jgi:PAS domain S-box-containing protein
MLDALHLFLVEDEDDIAFVIRKNLERAGHEVTTCRTAADALIVLGHTAFNLVILDQELPDMKGLDLLRTLQRDGIATPVLIITAYGNEHLATQALQAGALDYVVKDPALTFLVDLPKRVAESVTRHRLQEFNRLLIQALESARDGVMITDLSGAIQHVNQALEGMTGYTRGEMIGCNPRLFKSGMHPPEQYAELWRTILARCSWQGELINRRKDGTLLDSSVTIAPVLDERGQMTHFVGIYRDIGERKQLERQLLQAQKMQSVGTLAGGIAHEFNNLLAGIQGYAALAVRESGLPAPAREFLEFIIQLTDRAANLTKQLLAFARKSALSRQPVQVEKLLRSTVDLVRHTLRLEVELELSEAATDSEPLTALADANQLQQVLINLALNARDAMNAREQEKGSVATDFVPDREPIVFALRQVQLAGDLPGFPEIVPMGDYVVLEVRDTGCGMAQEVLSQAFDPFFSTKGVGQGTGLGLPVAFGIVHGHQGFMTVDTVVNEGTSVNMYLPRLLSPDKDKAADEFEKGQVLEPETIVGRHILVVDDEEAVLDVVRRFLEIAGHHVTCRTTGKEALAWLRSGAAVDLVVLDLMIPREEGAKNFQAIQDVRPGVPVLICTGLLQTAPGTPTLAESARGILRKPFRMNELWYAVHQALEE